MKKTNYRWKSLLLVAFFSFGVFVWSKGYSSDLQPVEDHPRTAKMVVDQVRFNHFTQNTRLNDELSSEIFDDYLESLDSGRMFLLADDINEFEKHRFHLDDSLRLGKLDIGFDIFNRVQERQVDRYRWVLDRLSKGFDSFDLHTDDTMLDRSKDVEWPVDEADADRIWEQLLVDRIIRGKLREEPENDAIIDELIRFYERRLRIERQTNSDDAFGTYINAFTRWFDPHTEYLTVSQEDHFNVQMSLSLQGIGAALNYDDEYIQIYRLIPGGPAEQHGNIKEKDLILAVGQEADGPRTNVVGWRLEDVIQLIKGPKGTTVYLELVQPQKDEEESEAAAADTPEILQPNEDEEIRVVAIVRDTVKLEDQAASKRVLDIDDGELQRRIGVIDIPSMYLDMRAKQRGERDYRSATRDVRKLINELRAENVDGLVIDLRQNGGGALDEARTLTGLFIPTGPTVLVKSSRGRADVYRDTNPEIAWDGPLAVLVDHGSASASEIFAAAIQDYGRGLVVGEQSFGKGTVQQLVPVRRGKLKITQHKFYRITGRSTQQHGVTPDIEFPNKVDRSRSGESRHENALDTDVIEGPKYRVIDDLSPYIEDLAQLHVERTREDPDFVLWRAYEQRNNDFERKYEISLNLDKRREERREDNQWALEVQNARLIGREMSPMESLKELPDKLEELRKIEQDQPDRELVEVGHILNDFINLHNPLALTESDASTSIQ
ncbi:MAG: carboxy terminal-processing peptidase [Gammaproteobacteria bacterium]|nr:carboxy terminal-processing peptidase [Gammaproteobacteria bacterium]